MPKSAPQLTLQDLVDELERRERTDPLAEVYTPGSENHKRIHQSRTSLMVIYGANRAGKTTALIAEALLYCLHRPTWAELPDPPVTVWYVIPSMSMWDRVIRPVFMNLCPQDAVIHYREKPSMVFTFANGSQLHVLSSDMTSRRLQGGTVHMVIMDETPHRKAFGELQARVMSTRGRVILGFAPVESDSNWVRDELYLPWLAGDRIDIEVLVLPIADKETGEPLVPWFTKRDIDSFKLKWPDPQEQAARLYGEPMLRAGNVYWSYDPEIHLVEPFTLPDHWSRWISCDPQYHRFAMLWHTVDEYGNEFITDEMFSQQESIRDRVMRAAAITEARGKVDPSLKIPVYVDSANQQEIIELNWHFNAINAPLAAVSLPMKKEVGKMTSRVQSLMEPIEDHIFPKQDPKEEDVYGSPRLFFFSSLYSQWQYEGVTRRCSRLLWELEHYKWGKDNKPDDKSADGADCCAALRYGCSIMMSSVQEKDEDAWKRNMDPKDVITWTLIERERAERRSLLAGEERGW